MAFTILDGTGTNLVNLTIPPAATQIPLAYTRNTSNKWLYCNWPEGLRANEYSITALGDKTYNGVTFNYYLNKAQNLPAGTYQLFYSYRDAFNFGPLYVGMQIWNPNASSITFTDRYHGYKTAAANTLAGDFAGMPWQDYFASSPSSPYTINATSAYWAFENSIPQGYQFTGNINFQISNTATIFLYIYKVRNSIDGTAIAYPTSGDPRMYSGLGAGYFSTASTITLKASELTNGKYFLLTYPDSFSGLTINGTSATSDLIPITQVGSGITYSPPTANLGNWSAQYYYTLALKNDLSTSKTFEAYVRADYTLKDSTVPIIQSGSQCKYAQIRPETTTNNAWRWLSQTVAAGQTYTDSFQYILGTNSFGKQKMYFKLA